MDEFNCKNHTFYQPRCKACNEMKEQRLAARKQRSQNETVQPVA